MLVKVLQLSAFNQTQRPASGWLRPLRDSLGLTLAAVAQRLKVTPPAVRAFELAEAEDRITLASLRRVAAAMDCELVYALVPLSDSALLLPAIASAPTRGGRTGTAIAPNISETDDIPKKVTDLTWHTLHGDP